MRTSSTIRSILGALALAWLPARAGIYLNATRGNYGGPEVDLSSVRINNDPSHISFQINMNTAADLGVNHYASSVTAVPEPGGLVLPGAGLSLLAVRRSRARA